MDREPDAGDFVMVPVPARHYARVVALLAELSAPSPSTAAPSSDPGDAPAVDAWPASDLAKLANVNPMAKAILDLGAQRYPEWVSLAEAARAAGVKETSGRTYLRWLTQHIAKIGCGDRDWPFKADYVPPARTEFGYQVLEQVARTWKTVAKKSSR